MALSDLKLNYFAPLKVRARRRRRPVQMDAVADLLAVVN